MAQHDALGVDTAAAEGNGKSPVAGEIAALRDRAHLWGAGTLRD